MERYSPERSSSIKKIDLLSNEGLNSFKKALEKSGSCAAMIVHPYYPEKKLDKMEDDEKENFELYKARLEKAVQRYQRLNLPLVIMEEESNTPCLDKILNRMGLRSRDIFVIETEEKNTDPVGRDFLALTKRLKKNGLEKAIVAGSCFWKEDLNNLDDYGYAAAKKYIPSRKNVIPLLNRYYIYGCAGSVIEDLIEADIYATPAFAVYPGRFEDGSRGNWWKL